MGPLCFVLAHIHPIVQYDVYSQEPQLHVEPLAGEWDLQPHWEPQRVRGRVSWTTLHSSLLLCCLPAGDAKKGQWKQPGSPWLQLCAWGHSLSWDCWTSCLVTVAYLKVRHKGVLQGGRRSVVHTVGLAPQRGPKKPRISVLLVSFQTRRSRHSQVTAAM